MAQVQARCTKIATAINPITFILFTFKNSKMQITKAKLKSGTFLNFSYYDDGPTVTKDYDNVEVSQEVQKAFLPLNRHLCRLTEQHDKTGELDFDNVFCYSFAMNDKEGITLSGRRVLSNGKNLTIPASETIYLDGDGDYKHATQLFEDVGYCRDAILKFAREQKTQEDIQGKLFDTKPENVVLSSKKETAADVVFPQATEQAQAAKEGEYIQFEEAPEKNWVSQPGWDKMPPLPSENATEPPIVDRFNQLKELAKERDLTTAEQQELQKLNADSKKKAKNKK